MFETDLCYIYKLEKSYKVNEGWKKKNKQYLLCIIVRVANCYLSRVFFFLYFKILISLHLYNAKCIWKDITDPVSEGHFIWDFGLCAAEVKIYVICSHTVTIRPCD